MFCSKNAFKELFCDFKKYGKINVNLYKTIKSFILFWKQNEKYIKLSSTINEPNTNMIKYQDEISKVPIQKIYV